jgi:hypothetical protein
MFRIVAFEMIDDCPQALAFGAIEFDEDRKMGARIVRKNWIARQPLFAGHKSGKT